MPSENPIIAFDSFIDFLKEEGFLVGVDTYLQVQIIVNRMGKDVPAEKLKHLICPILATTSLEQERFYVLFNAYFKVKEVKEESIHKPGGKQPKPKPIVPTRPSTKPFWLIAVAIVVLGTDLLIYINTGCRIDENRRCSADCNPEMSDIDRDGVIDSCDPDDDDDGILDINDLCPTIHNSEEDIDCDGTLNNDDNCPEIPNSDQKNSDGDTTGDVCDKCPEISDSKGPDDDCDGLVNSEDECPQDSTNQCNNQDADSDGVVDSLDNCPVDYNPNQNDSDFDGLGDVCDDKNDLQELEPLPPIEADISDLEVTCSDTTTLDSDRRENIINNLLGWISFCLLVLLLTLNFYKHKRKKAIRKRELSASPPSRLELSFEHWKQKIPLQRSHLLLRDLRERISGNIQQLDIPKSIDATIGSAGFPNFKYMWGKKPPEYLIFLERFSISDQQTALFDKLMGHLEKQGVALQLFYFDKDPRVCYNAKSLKRTSLYNLNQQFPKHKVLFVGSCHGWINEFTFKADEWVKTFTQGWKEKVILSTLPPEDWSYEEVVLAGYFPIVPIGEHLQGLRQAVQLFIQDKGLFQPTNESNEHIKLELDPDIMSSEEMVIGLKQGLSPELFDWLCACAVYPELHWDLTLYLGDRLSDQTQLINTQNLLQLVRLPWFREGNMPDDLRVLLIKTLGKEKEQKVRRALLELLQKQKPRKGSGSEAFHNMQVALQKLVVYPEQKGTRKTALKSLADTSLNVLDRDVVVLETANTFRSKISTLFPTWLFEKNTHAFGLNIKGFNLLLFPVLLVFAYLLINPFRNTEPTNTIIQAPNGLCYELKDHGDSVRYYSGIGNWYYWIGEYDSAFYYSLIALAQKVDNGNIQGTSFLKSTKFMAESENAELVFNYTSCANMLPYENISQILDEFTYAPNEVKPYYYEFDKLKKSLDSLDQKERFLKHHYNYIPTVAAKYNRGVLSYNSYEYLNASRDFSWVNDFYADFNDSSALRKNALYYGALSNARLFWSEEAISSLKEADSISVEDLKRSTLELLSTLINLDEQYFCHSINQQKRNTLEFILKNHFAKYEPRYELDFIQKAINCQSLMPLTINVQMSLDTKFDTARFEKILSGENLSYVLEWNDLTQGLKQISLGMGLITNLNFFEDKRKDLVINTFSQLGYPVSLVRYYYNPSNKDFIQAVLVSDTTGVSPETEGTNIDTSGINEKLSNLDPITINLYSLDNVQIDTTLLSRNLLSQKINSIILWKRMDEKSLIKKMAQLGSIDSTSNVLIYPFRKNEKHSEIDLKDFLRLSGNRVDTLLLNKDKSVSSYHFVIGLEGLPETRIIPMTDNVNGWVKQNYYRVHRSLSYEIEVNALEINTRNNTVTFKLIESPLFRMTTYIPDTITLRVGEESTLRSLLFYRYGDTYTIRLDKIDNAGKNPFTKAAYYTLGIQRSIKNRILTNFDINDIWMKQDGTRGWAVGTHGVILHYDGKTWNQHPHFSQGLGYLRTVCFDEGGFLGWAAGDNNLFLHFDGNDWKQSSTPVIEQFSRINKIWLYNKGLSGWAVGSEGKILKLNRKDWVNYQDPQTVKSTNIKDLWLNENGTIGVALNDLGMILSLVDNTWMMNQTGGSDIKFNTFWTSDNGSQGWMGGTDGVLFPFDVHNLKSIGLPQLTSLDIYSIQLNDKGTLGWAAGQSGLLLSYDGKTWNSYPSSNKIDKKGSTSQNDFYNDRKKNKKDKSSKESIINSTPKKLTESNLNAIWLNNSGSQGWAVGDNGVILRLENGDWSVHSKSQN